jgi:AraC-like DNA-binding protein
MDQSQGPRVMRITRGQDHPGADVLFSRVDAFRFVGADRGDMLVRSFKFGSVTLATVVSTGHQIALHEPGLATFLAPVSGTLGVEAHGHSLAAGSCGGLYLRPGHRTTTVRPGGRERFTAMVALAPSLPHRRGTPARRPGRAFATTDADAVASALRSHLAYLLPAIERPGAPLLRPASQRASEALIIDLLRAIETADTPVDRRMAPETRVGIAEEFMRAHSDQPLTVEEIARAADVGPRALQIAFRALRGTSPRAMLAALRLERARERLMEPSATETVTDIALDSGFLHFGRFAAAYRARFGEVPSETIRRVRR